MLRVAGAVLRSSGGVSTRSNEYDEMLEVSRAKGRRESARFGGAQVNISRLKRDFTFQFTVQ